MDTTHATYRVLIARDESAAKTGLNQLLESVGCQILGHTHGKEATLEQVRALKPDCVFLAMRLDSSDGIELVDVLRAEQLVPVIVLSTSTQPQTIEDVVKAGAHGYLAKPFSEKDIIPALRIAISRFAETRILAEEVEELQDKLEARKLVERAKGILMEDGLSESEAFSRLQKLSMNTGRSVKDLADAIILSDELRSR